MYSYFHKLISYVKKVYFAIKTDVVLAHLYRDVPTYFGNLKNIDEKPYLAIMECKISIEIKHLKNSLHPITRMNQEPITISN